MATGLSLQSLQDFDFARKALPECTVINNPTIPQHHFINNSAKDVVLSCVGTALFPSITMAQMCLESLYGTKHIGQANNYFGFKGCGTPNEYWDGRVISKDTIENFNGKDTTIKDKFRVYDSQLASLLDRNRLLQTKRYASVIASTNPVEQAQNIKNSGYATDPSYPKKLIWIVDKFGLRKLDDLKLKFEQILNQSK